MDAKPEVGDAFEAAATLGLLGFICLRSMGSSVSRADVWPSAAHWARRRLRPILRASVSTRRILTSTSSPGLTTSCGLSILWSASSEMCSRPSSSCFEFDKDAEVGELGNVAFDDLAGDVLFGNGMHPRVFGQLLDTKRDTLLFLINFEHNTLDLLTFLQGFAGMIEFLCPAQIADVNKAVDAGFDLDKCAVIGKAADLGGDDRAGRILLCGDRPRVGLGLLEAQRDFLLVLVDIEHDHFDLVVEIENVGGMGDAFCPAHFADMDKAFDAFFEADKHAVVHDIDDGALDLGADRVFLFDLFPRACRLLLEAERNLFVLLIYADNDTLNRLVELDNFRRMRNPAPAKIGDMEQAVETAEINEHAEIGDILDNALANLADFNFGKQFFFAGGAFFFDEFAARDNDVVAFGVDLEDFALDFRTDETADIAGLADIDL